LRYSSLVSVNVTLTVSSEAKRGDATLKGVKTEALLSMSSAIMLVWFVILMANMIESLRSKSNLNCKTPSFRGKRIQNLDPLIASGALILNNKLVLDKIREGESDGFVFGPEDLSHFIEIHLIMLLEKEQDRDAISVAHDLEWDAVKTDWMHHSIGLGEGGI
jgi:hypothetical protein